MKPKEERKKVVVIGGGTGTYTLLHGLKRHWGDINITKIVSMADSGGSNARIRDEFGLLPLSDVNRGLAALSSDVEDHEQLLRELFLYRFHQGNGVAGHNFGNLLLVALTDMLGSEAEAIKAASHILRVRGSVLPVTADDIHLIATYDDGVEVIGEHDIDEPSEERANHRVVSLRSDVPGHVTKDADRAIREADIIILGPGDLYTSLMANCVIEGVPEAIQASTGKFVYVSNLMSRPGQTRGMKISDYIREVETYTGRKPDVAIINTTPLPEDALLRYKKEGDEPVEDDLTNSLTIVRGDFVLNEVIKKESGDVLVRSLIRHDGTKLADAIMELLG